MKRLKKEKENGVNKGDIMLMPKRRHAFFIILFSVSLCFIANIFAFDDQATHPDITDKALKDSNIEQYIIVNLGLKDGLKTCFPSENKEKSIINLLKKGSTDEDSPMCRATNHFHNPLLSWDKSFMSDDITPLASLIRDFCNVTGWLYLLRQSDVTWATGYTSPAPDGKKSIPLSLYTIYNWDRARNNFYKALTLSTNTEREYHFAQTFEAVGHVLHLLQDVAVPAHVRNDFESHLTFNEVKFQDPRKWANQPFEYFLKINRDIIDALNPGSIPPAFSEQTLTNFWDTDQYKGASPSSSLGIGLAEFTNANFLSDTTIFKGFLSPLHSFPYPAWTSIQEYDETNPYTLEKTTYLRKVSDGERIEHLATGKWYYKYLPSILKNTGLELDDKCHYDYAQKLLPRAVGYSAGLLNYFFRGEIDLVSDGVTGSGYVIENNSDEDMEGTFELWYDDTNDNRKMIWSGFLSIVPNGKSTNITFTPPTDAKSCKYILVLNKGQLGEEEGAVVGKVVDTTENCSALTIVNENGTPARDTILRNGSNDYKVNGDCCGEVLWSVSPTTGGTSISQAGVLTAGATSCGSLLVTATCAGCGTSDTHAVRVTNCGQWKPYDTFYYPSGEGDEWRWWGASKTHCDRIVGDTKIEEWVILANSYFVRYGNSNYDPTKFTCTPAEYQGCDSTCYGRSYATPYEIYYERDVYGHYIWDPCTRSWEGGYCSYKFKREIIKWEGI